MYFADSNGKNYRIALAYVGKTMFRPSTTSAHPTRLGGFGKCGSIYHTDDPDIYAILFIYTQIIKLGMFYVLFVNQI